VSVTFQPSLAAQVGPVARRSIAHVFRQPVPLFAAVIFPLMLLAVNVSDIHQVTHLPGFPTQSYLSFALAFVFVMGALYIVVSAGTELARDIESGYLNRLALTRISRRALLAGMFAGPLVMMLIEATIYLLVGALAGAHIATGLVGALAIVGFALAMGVAFAALGLFASLRSGSTDAVQAMLPLLFAALFMTSMSLPRGLIHTPWFRDVATYNPVSYLVEAIRALIISGWDAKPLLIGVGATAVLGALSLTAASLALRTRLGGNLTRRADPQPRRHNGVLAVSLAVARRAIHNYFHDPALLVPSLLFPLFFFAAFAGGLSSLHNVPGFHFAAGYSAFQFVYVLLQAVIYGGVFTGITIALDLQSGFTKRLLLAAPNRVGVLLGYVFFGVIRGFVPAAALIAVALIIGMRVSDSAPAPQPRAALSAYTVPTKPADKAAPPVAAQAPLKLRSALAPVTIPFVAPSQQPSHPPPVVDHRQAVAAPANSAPDAVDFLGLAVLVVLANIAASLAGLGLAMRIRSAQAAPLLQLAMFVVLFLAPVYAPLNLISGWIHGLASINPITALLEAGRGFISGQPTIVATAFACAVGVAGLSWVWARSGLRQLERAE